MKARNKNTQCNNLTATRTRDDVSLQPHFCLLPLTLLLIFDLLTKSFVQHLFQNKILVSDSVHQKPFTLVRFLLSTFPMCKLIMSCTLPKPLFTSCLINSGSAIKSLEDILFIFDMFLSDIRVVNKRKMNDGCRIGFLVGFLVVYDHGLRI